MKNQKTKDIEYWKTNATEDYIGTPISVLRYISELEKRQVNKNSIFQNVMHRLYPYRFIAVFVIAVVLAYLFIR